MSLLCFCLLGLFSLCKGDSEVYVVTSDKKVRLVSTYSDCSTGRVEFYSSKKWSTFADCSDYLLSTDLGSICSSLGFSEYNYDSWIGLDDYLDEGHKNISNIPKYCGFNYLYCYSIYYSDVCDDCDISWNSYDCSDRDYFCHDYDLYLSCSGSTYLNCLYYSDGNDLTNSGSKCKGDSWNDTVSTLAAGYIALIVIAPTVIIFICIICCIRRRRRYYNPYVAPPTTTAIIYQQQPVQQQQPNVHVQYQQQPQVYQQQQPQYQQQPYQQNVYQQATAPQFGQYQQQQQQQPYQQPYQQQQQQQYNPQFQQPNAPLLQNNNNYNGEGQQTEGAPN